MQIKRYIICLLLPCVSLVGAPSVFTNSGPIVGSEVTYNGTRVNRFLGIPYARPPVGRLRFQRTEPVRRWFVPLVANTLPPSCWQYFPYAYPWADIEPGKSEDCLFLNVWAPKSPIFSRPSKAVMVWVHGGGFAIGSSRLHLYDGHVLAAEGDVVVVTVNYRLSIFGFLSTNHSDDAPGNMGLYDVLEALEWVNKNIHVFGGDKERVTLFGQSAGSYTCAYFTVSPLTKGLFQQTIMESGAQDGSVSLGQDTREQNQMFAQEVAKKLNCSTDNVTFQNSPRKVVSCLRKRSAEDLVKAVTTLNSSLQNFLPVYGDELLPKTLFEAVELGLSHDVTILIGNVQDEASIAFTAYYPEQFGPYGGKDPDVNKTFARDFIESNLMNIRKSDEIADYFLDDVPDDDYDTIRRQAYFATGDFISFCPPLYFAEMLSDRRRDVYYFYYNHQTENTVFAPWMGVTHTIEVPFVFGRPFDTDNYTSAERAFSKKVMRYWADFAKFGKPSKTWEKFSRNNTYSEILRIDENYPNYLGEQFENCMFLRDYYFF